MKNFETQLLLTFLTSDESAFVECTLNANIKIQKNIKILKDYINDLNNIKNKFLKPNNETLNYDKNKLELLDPYLQFTINNGSKQYLFKDNIPQLLPGTEHIASKLIQEFNLDHKELISKVNIKKQEWQNFLQNNEADVILDLISINDLTLPVKFKKSSYQILSLILKEDN